MSRSIDIRKENDTEIDRIVFADCVKWNALATHIRYTGLNTILINWYSSHVYLGSKEDTINLIKALEKAIELEWVK